MIFKYLCKSYFYMFYIYFGNTLLFIEKCLIISATNISYFSITNIEPLYYDLLLTSQIDFPVHPRERYFIQKEKLLHIISENFISICATATFLMSNGSNMVATISLVASCVMTFCLLFAGGCEILYIQEAKKGDHLNAKVILRKEEMKGRPRRKTLRREIEKMLDASFVISMKFFLMLCIISLLSMAMICY